MATAVTPPGSFLSIVMELAKVRITVMVTVTTAMGWVLARAEFDLAMLVPVLGVFLLACGSATLNHIQERETDAKMVRTRRRPIPSGRIGVVGALCVAAAFIAAGSALLAVSSLVALTLGIITLLWYNAIYTPLKRISAFAVVPGSVIGALPPLIGWAAAGGALLDPRALAVGFFFFIWQVPHFWLLVLVHGEDYARAGLPSLTSKFESAQLSRMTFIWIATTAAAGLFLPMFALATSPWLVLALVVASLALVLHCTRLLSREGRPRLFFSAFGAINLYALFVVLVLSLDALGL